MFAFSQSRVSTFEKAGVRTCRETGVITGFEEFCEKMDLSSDQVDVTAAASYTRTTSVKYKVAVAPGGNQSILSLTQIDSRETSEVSVEERKDGE